MNRSSPSSSPRADFPAVAKAREDGAPRYGWTVAALLVPMAVLLGLASVALVRDWRAARREAVAAAQEVARDAAQALEAVLAGGEGTGVDGASATGARETFEVGEDYRMTRPRPALWPPVPEALPEGDAASAQAWQQAAEATAKGDWAAAERAWAGVMEGNAGERSGAEDSTSVRRRVLARFERALALERLSRGDEAKEEFDRVIMDVAGRGAGPIRTEAGVPVEQLAMLRLLDLAEGRQAALPRRWQADGIAAADRLGASAPTPYLARIFAELSRMAAENGEAGGEGRRWGESYRRAERARRRHAAAMRQWGAGAAWPSAFWLEAKASDEEPVLVWESARVRPGHREFGCVGEGTLRRVVSGAFAARDRRGDFVGRVTVAGRTWEVPGDGGGGGRLPVEVLAETGRALRGGATLGIEVALRSADAYFAEQRRRIWIFGGLTVAAAVAAVVAAWMTVRTLRRQEALNRARSNFVSSVSHELRAPLGSIRLLAEGLERGTAGEEEKRTEYFRLIGQETRRLGALVENVLDFSRMDQGRKRYEFEPSDLRAMTEGTLRVFAPLAGARGVRWELEPSDDATSMEAVVDARALQQALLNLLDNALKHSPSGATIRVGLAVDAARNGFAIRVTDEGPGIPAEDHGRIFEPFYRRGSELRRETQGVGIGLAIVRHVMAGHGGTVEVTSEPGRGATFVLRVPADARRGA